MQSCLKWHGAKGAFQGKLAKWIISKMPPHTHYVEPYFGSGAVLFAKDPNGVSEVVNDLDGNLMNFWRTLQDQEMFERLLRLAEATPFSEGQWEFSNDLLADSDDVFRAWAFFTLCRQSLAGRMKDFATLSRNRTRRGMNEQASAWLTSIEGLPEVHARLKRVVILNRSAIEVIKSQDGPETCFYCDPPYLHETRTSCGEYGEFEMSLADHVELLGALVDLKGKFLLSGYRSVLYDLTAEAHHWNRHEFEIPNNAAGGEKKRTMTEVLWTNF